MENSYQAILAFLEFASVSKRFHSGKTTPQSKDSASWRPLVLRRKATSGSVSTVFTAAAIPSESPDFTSNAVLPCSRR